MSADHCTKCTQLSDALFEKHSHDTILLITRRHDVLLGIMLSGSTTETEHSGITSGSTILFGSLGAVAHYLRLRRAKRTGDHSTCTTAD